MIYKFNKISELQTNCSFKTFWGWGGKQPSYHKNDIWNHFAGQTFSGKWREMGGSAWGDRVRFNNSWFVFHDSNCSFHQTYFSRKRILHESFRVIRTQDYGLNLQTSTKLSENVIILKTFLSTISSIVQFFTKQKFCKHHFSGAGNNKWISRDNLTIQAFIYHSVK